MPKKIKNQKDQLSNWKLMGTSFREYFIYIELKTVYNYFFIKNIKQFLK